MPEDGFANKLPWQVVAAGLDFFPVPDGFNVQHPDEENLEEFTAAVRACTLAGSACTLAGSGTDMFEDRRARLPACDRDRVEAWTSSYALPPKFNSTGARGHAHVYMRMAALDIRDNPAALHMGSGSKPICPHHKHDCYAALGTRGRGSRRWPRGAHRE